MKQMIAACTRLCRPARRLCLLLLAGLLLVACREAEAFLQFAQVDPNGWTRGTGYVFTVDSLPTTQDYPLSVMLRKSSDKAYPFRSITLVVANDGPFPCPMLRLKRAPTPDVISRRSDNRGRPAACATVYSWCATTPSWQICRPTTENFAHTAFRCTLTHFRSPPFDYRKAQRDVSPYGT